MQKLSGGNQTIFFSPGPPLFGFKHRKVCLNLETKHALTLSRPLNKWMSTLYRLRARPTAATYMSTSDSTLNFLQKAEQAPHIYAATFLINTPKKLSSQLENPIRHRPLTIVASTILLYHCQRVFTYQIHVNKTISLYHYSLVQFY